MRLWSFHPKYLDPVGLSRLINEGISGYKALTGKQKMWQNHSQLTRFKNHPKRYYQIYMILICNIKYNQWMNQLNDDIIINGNDCFDHMTVTRGQLEYEWKHYLNKLQSRNPTLYGRLKGIVTPEPHPIFKVIPGSIESWEKVK